MDKVKTNKAFVFFYKDFKRNFYFWECWIFLRKFFLTFLSSMGGSMPLEIIHLFMLSIILLSLYATIKYSPFKSKNTNYVEVFSLIVCTVSIFSVYFFNSLSNDLLKKTISVICIFLNASFLVFVLCLILLDIMRDFQIKRKYSSKLIKKMSGKKKQFFDQKKELTIS